MAKCNRTTHPELFGYLEAYGMAQYVIDNVDRIKENSVYAVVGWKRDDGKIELMDLAPFPDRSTGPSGDVSKFGWNMLNDGMLPIEEKDWNKLRLVPEVENFVIAGHEEYGC